MRDSQHDFFILLRNFVRGKLSRPLRSRFGEPSPAWRVVNQFSDGCSKCLGIGYRSEDAKFALFEDFRRPEVAVRGDDRRSTCKCLGHDVAKTLISRR